MKTQSISSGNSTDFKRVFRISFIIFFLAVSYIHDVSAKNELSKKQIRKLSKADNFLARHKHKKALRIFTKLMADSVINNQIFYKTGLCYYGIQKYTEAIIFLKQSIMVSNDIIPESEYFLGKCYFFNSEYQEALFHYVKFKKMLTILAQVNQSKSKEFTDLANALNKEIDLCKIEIKHYLIADLKEDEDSTKYYLLKDADSSEEIYGSNVLLIDNENVVSDTTTHDRLFTFLNLPPNKALVPSLPKSIIEEISIPEPVVEQNELPEDTVAVPERKIFVVQIGAFRYTPSTDFLTSVKNLKSYVTQDGITRYTVGSFKEKAPAIKLKEDLIKLGFKGAFISMVPD